MQASVSVLRQFHFHQRDSRRIVALLHVGARERQACRRIGGIEARRTLQECNRVVDPLQFQERFAAHREQLRIVAAALEQRLKGADRSVEISGVIVGRAEFSQEVRIARRQLQRRLEFSNRIGVPALPSGEGGSNQAPLARVRQGIELLEGGTRELGCGTRGPVSRFRIRLIERAGQHDAVASRAKLAERFPAGARGCRQDTLGAFTRGPAWMRRLFVNPRD